MLQYLKKEKSGEMMGFIAMTIIATLIFCFIIGLASCSQNV